MWITAIKKFRDKETNERINVGDNVNFKKERAEDCIKRGLAKKKE